MDENNKPNVFPKITTNDAPNEAVNDAVNEAENQQPMLEAEKQMIANRERELAERNMAKTPTQPIEPVLGNKNFKMPIVEPDFDSDFDLVPLPSGGKTYKNKNKTLKISYLNASDENILSNPNLGNSGKFLEVLFTRKILDTSINYRDLVIGDRDAIMIWLRATGHGNMYPIQVFDPETYEEFPVEIDLDDLNTKKLELEPDDEGYFDFELPLSKKNIKFKLLTVGDVDEIEEHGELLKKNKEGLFDLATYTLQKQIVDVEGNRDPKYINDFVNKMRLLDSRAFKKYVSDNECGIDLDLTVKAPGGSLVKTFFRINGQFFWPEL